jgi:hypothetical protein
VPYFFPHPLIGHGRGNNFRLAGMMGTANSSHLPVMCITMAMTNINDVTTISISRRNHARLQELGRKGATFDDILTEVLENKRKKKRPSLQNADSGES